MTNSELKCECPARKVLERILPYITRLNHFHLSEQPKEILYASAVYDALAVPCPCEQLRAALTEALKALEPFAELGSSRGPLRWVNCDRAAAVLAKHKERAS